MPVPITDANQFGLISTGPPPGIGEESSRDQNPVVVRLPSGTSKRYWFGATVARQRWWPTHFIVRHWTGAAPCLSQG